MNKFFPLFVCAAMFSVQAVAQNVGIGTNTPQTKLQVEGAISSTPASGTPSGGSVNIPSNVSVFRILDDGSSTAITVTAGTAYEGQYLTIYNTDAANNATFSGQTIVATTGVASFSYIGGGWRTVSNTKAGGDLSGSYPNPAVVKIQGKAVSTTAPANGEILKYNSTSGQYEPSADLNSGGIVGTVTASSPLASSGGATPNITLASTVPVSLGGTGLGLGTVPNGQILIGNGTNFSNNTLSGTTNQVNIANGAGTITLSTPQNIATSSDVTFNTVAASGANVNSVTATGSIKPGTTTALATTAGAGAIRTNGTNLDYSDGTTWKTLSSGGTVTNVTGTAPIVSSGGSTPAISITAATGSAAGSMSAADKAKLDAITGTNTGDQTITLTNDVTGSGTGSFATTIAANAVNSGKIADGTVANADLATMGANTIKGSVTGTGAPIDLSVAQTKTMLNLAGTNSGDQTITLTGDVTGSGTGSFATTLATVNTTTPGTYGSATTVPVITVNGKGLVTASSSATISGVAPAGAAGGGLTGTYPNPTIAANAVGSSNITDGTVTGTDIAAGTVTSSNITDGTIAAADIAATGVTAGTYNNVTVNTQGQVTAGVPRTITGTANQIDITNGNFAANPNVGVNPSYTADTKVAANITGGGTITYNGSFQLSWSNRFIVISNGSGSHFSTNGYFDINMPANGTVIPTYGGATAQTVAGSVITIQPWQALYYILPVGSTNGSLSANFVMASYTAAMVVPETWVLIAVRNGDDNTLKLGTGQILAAGQSTSSASGYINNQSSPVQSANFNISGTGTIASNLNVGGYHYQNTSFGQGSGAHGISWYSPSFVTWFDYMSPPGTTNSPSGTAAPTDATSGVTSWARRFNIENLAGYGWLFESGANTAGSAPTVKFAINSNTGSIHAVGNANIDGSVTAGASAILCTNCNAGYYQDATNGAYRAIVGSGTTNGYYFQTNAGGTTTMYVGLGGAYNGNVGIGTTTPAAALTMQGDRYALFGPNSIWSATLRVGGNGNVDNNASVMTTNGNLHLDAASGTSGLYLNWYKGTGGIQFGNGTSSGVGSIDNGGYLTTIGAHNTNVGYRVGGAAASGNYLRGNGTNFVSSPLVAGDISALGFIPNNGVGDWQIASSSTSTAYNLASLELRESNFTGTSAATPPHLGFHWGGVVASNIAIESSGRIAIRDNPGTGYENFIARHVQTTGDLRVDGVMTCLQGQCPTNNAMRMTPNFHLNSGSGNAVIVNWDNGTSGATQTFRTTGDGFYVYADGQTFTTNWFRPKGTSGLYFQDYGGGWNMVDATWIRSYNSKPVYIDQLMRADGGVYCNDQVRFKSNQVGELGQAAGVDFGLSGVNIEQGLSEGGGFHADGDQADIWSPGDGDRLLRVLDEDNFGTEAAAERWYINGSGSSFSVSDINKKQNIVPLNSAGALSKILSVSGYNYEFKKTAEEIAKGDFPRKTAGVLAQEVEKYMPELVQTNTEGSKFMNYEGLTPYLIESVKELQNQIDQTKETTTDFGSVALGTTELWVNYADNFAQALGTSLPVITLTANQPNVNIYVAEKNEKGFKIKLSSAVPAGLIIDYVALTHKAKAVRVNRTGAEYFAELAASKTRSADDEKLMKWNEELKKQADVIKEKMASDLKKMNAKPEGFVGPEKSPQATITDPTKAPGYNYKATEPSAVPMPKN